MRARRIPAMEEHRSADELTAALDDIRRSPAANGTVELIVRRPAENEREVLDEGVLDLELGLVGDAWKARGSSRTPDRSANPDAQLTLMNARAAQAIAGTQGAPAARRRPALRRPRPQHREPSRRHPPRGRRRRDRGDARAAHRLRQVQRPLRNRGSQVREQVPGRELRLRGVNTRVVTPGTVRAGDAISKL